MADDRLRQLERAQLVDPHDADLQEAVRRERLRAGMCEWCGNGPPVPRWTILDMVVEIGPGGMWETEIPARAGDRVRGTIAPTIGAGELHLLQGQGYDVTAIGAGPVGGPSAAHSFNLRVDRGPAVKLRYFYGARWGVPAELHVKVNVGRGEGLCRDCPNEEEQRQREADSFA